MRRAHLSLPAEVAKKIAEERYNEFDNKCKKTEALAADKEDFKQLEEIEKELRDKRNKK